jgi:uncharacterized protein (TIGR03437 family)
VPRPISAIPALVPLLVWLPAFGQSGLVVQDIFGRTLNQAGITLVDWDGYMANPAIKFQITAPPDAAFPASATLTANNQRLYFDLPSTIAASGPSKTVQFPSASSKATVYLGNAPDRDSVDGNFQSTIQFTDANKKVTTLVLPIHEIDQDQQTANPPYTINIDFSQDKTGFFNATDTRAVVQQEVSDWAYFFDDMRLDRVPVGAEATFIWNSDGFVSGKAVTNASAYTGYLLYVYGIHSSALRSGGEVSAQGGFQTSGGVKLQLKRSGGMEIETAGNYNTLPWLLSTSDVGWWVSGNLGNESNELFSIAHHESGHAMAFNPGQPNWAAFKTAGCINDAAVIAYHGTCLKIDVGDHFNGEIDNDSSFGAFGNEYNGKAPARRWFITKLDLLAAQAIGYKLRPVSAFVPLRISATAMPSGVVGQAFSKVLTAEGGIPFYNWILASGSLPDGLQLDSFSGTISGMPLKVGTFTFTIRVQEYKEGSPGVNSQFTITIGSAIDPNAPMITLAGTVNSGSYIGGAVAPGELVSLFGAKLGPSEPQGLQVANGKVTTSLAGVRVLFDGVPAPIILAYATQVNAIVPFSVAGKSTTMVQLEYLGVLSPPINMPVALAAPSIFTANGSGKGQISALNQDFLYNGAASPASGGSVVVFYITGAGQTSPSGVDGLVPSDPNNLATPAQSISVTIGGQNATVLYAGNTIGIVSGAMQLNVLVPNGLSPGDVPIVVKVGTAQSQPGATVAVR